MKRWLLSEGYGLWIAKDPPPDQKYETVYEVARPTRRDWEDYLRDADRHDQLTTDFVAILRRDGMPPALPFSAEQVREQLADMLRRGQVRLWRRQGPAGTSQGTASAPPPPPPVPSRRVTVPGPRMPSIQEIVEKVAPAIVPAIVETGIPAIIETVVSEILDPIEALVDTLPDGLLTWYEFRLADEAEGGIAGVKVTIDTPAGPRDCVTDGDGVARVDLVPPAKGTATIDPDSLATALASRVERPRRAPKPPEESDDFHVTTPRRAAKAWDLDMERRHEVMIVSRADLRVGGMARGWQDLALDDPLADPCRLYPDAAIALALCSWGQGRTGTVKGSGKDPYNAPADRPLPAGSGSESYIVQEGDSFWGLADRFLGDGWRYQELETANADLLAGRPPNMIHPGDVLRIPVKASAPPGPTPDPWPDLPVDPPANWMDLDVDGLHEALFDGDASDWFDTLAAPLSPPPDPPPPNWDPPVDAAAAYATNSAALTLENGPDPGDAVITDPVDNADSPPEPPEVS